MMSLLKPLSTGLTFRVDVPEVLTAMSSGNIACRKCDGNIEESLTLEGKL